MITPAKAQEDYNRAMAVFRQLAVTPDLTPEDRLAVRDGMRDLTAKYLDSVEMEIQALTTQYEDFIEFMTGALSDLEGGNTPVSALNDLKKIVDHGATLVSMATSAVPRGMTRRGAAKRAPAGARAVGAGALRILCVHGVGHQENDPTFEATWKEAITSGISHWNPNLPFELQFVAYDELFAADPPSALDVAEAVVKLGVSGVVYGVADLFRRRRGIGDIAESARWTAGMVVQWAENDRLRAAARKRVLDHAKNFQPQVILAHSLGSLLAYDAFGRPEGKALVQNATFVTFGSQIGNPFVRSTLGGRIQPVPAAHWFHLFNPHDNAFAASLRMSSSNFEQVDAEFDIEGMLDHDAGEYMRHPNTVNIVWRSVALANGGARGVGAGASAITLQRHAAKARPTAIKRPAKRALLVGINDYPNPEDRLQGCVNDVFLMSSLLQESGFEAENIRVVLNERATAAGILDRLEWLLQGTEDEQDRVFFYSGHGAQIPGYGIGETVDHKDECLVSYDFDWSREHAVTDDQFYELYSQLPYTARFLTIMDCCHSGGMTREGSARARGLTPPDDIRHRELEWDAKNEMWIPRQLAGVYDTAGEREKKPELFGERGAVNRMGRASRLRAETGSFKKALDAFGHKGPFMPIILQACEEKQYSFEYRHGTQSYGAFTYSLGVIMRDAKRRRRAMTWQGMIDAVTNKLASLRYDQKPCLVCPTVYRTQSIPWK